MDNGHRGVRKLATIVAIAVAAALVWVSLSTFWLWRNQERVVFQPLSLEATAPASAIGVDFLAADGHPIFGYLVSASRDDTAPSTVVLAFHGNADQAAWLVPWARELAQRSGASVLLPEYRGYARIPGAPTYVSAGADARGALELVRRRFA